MSYQVVAVQKFKAAAVGGINSHDKRLKESKTNPDIDRDRTKDNYNLAPEPARPVSFSKAAEKRIGELNLEKAVRKDAVVMAQVIVTSDARFFELLSEERKRKYFEDSYEFLKKHFGENNVISAYVHMDENTPHMHFNFVPVHDGKLCARDLLNQARLTGLHDAFHAMVGRKYGLERGVPGGQRKPMSTPEYKAYMELQKDLNDLQADMALESVRFAQEREELLGGINALENDYSAKYGEIMGKIDVAADLARTQQELLGVAAKYNAAVNALNWLSGVIQEKFPEFWKACVEKVRDLARPKETLAAPFEGAIRLKEEAGESREGVLDTVRGLRDGRPGQGRAAVKGLTDGRTDGKTENTRRNDGERG